MVNKPDLKLNFIKTMEFHPQVNPFAPEPPVTARVYPGLFYPL